MNNVYRSTFKDGSHLSVDADVEFYRRTKLLEVAVKNPNAFEQITKNNINLFHGTNINALPSILKYGLLSEDASYKNNIDVTTGEKWSRQEGVRRGFVSLTDDMETALHYASMQPTNNEQTSLSCGVIIGVSSDEMDDLDTYRVKSDFSEVGVKGALPRHKIKTLFVPDDKVLLVSQLVGDLPIAVTGLDGLYPEIKPVTYDKEGVKKLAETRKISGISKIKNTIKKIFNKIFSKDKENEGVERDD